MLSEKDIVEAMKKGEIVIDPFDQKMLRPLGYVFTLDPEIAIPLGGYVDPYGVGDFSEFFEKRMIKKEFVLEPGMFILAKTYERVRIKENIGMIVDGRSTLARLGLAIHQGAILINPGHGVPTKRKIVLEIKNNGPFEIVLKPRMPIADCAFFHLETPTELTYDKYFVYGKKPDELLPMREF